MELAKLYKRVVGLDVHQAKITACAITEDEAGQTSVELAEFGGFKRDRQAMAQWVAAHGAEMVVMESTGIYWKSPHAALEQVGIVATVVNARHVKTVPGIDAVGAALLLVEIGNDMSAFGSVDRLASWVGICPGNNESAGKRKTGRIRKGNP
jgi:Transposase IS116/IS110/IS902 family.